MRYRAVITEIFFIEVSFFEVRMNRAAFEYSISSPTTVLFV
jgi:hypothetical protein